MFVIDFPASLSGFILFNPIHPVHTFLKCSVCLMWFLSGTRRAEKYLFLLHLSKSAGGKHFSLSSLVPLCGAFCLFLFFFYLLAAVAQFGGLLVRSTAPVFSTRCWVKGHCSHEQTVPCKISVFECECWLLIIHVLVVHICQSDK